MRIRTIAAALAALTLPLTACGSNDGGSVTRSEGSCKEALQNAAGDETPEPCRGFTNAEVQSMAEEVFGDSGDVSTEEPTKEPASTSLAVGDTFTYEDGLAVTIDSIEKIIKYGEYDEHPDKGQTAFRVSITFTNNTGKPFDLDDVYLTAQGATNGGEVIDMFIEAGAKAMTGRVADGVKTTKTAEYAIDDQYGKKILLTFSRLSADWDAPEPEWTGDIR